MVSGISPTMPPTDIAFALWEVRKELIDYSSMKHLTVSDDSGRKINHTDKKKQ